MSQSINQEVHVIGVPLDHGAGRRGVGMGPSALRLAKLHSSLAQLGFQVVDRDDIAIPAPETESQGGSNARYLKLITKTCEKLCYGVQDICQQGGFPLILGGDHSIAIGSISGLTSFLAEKKKDAAPEQGIAVLWFDAHADINTPETSPSGNIHGMPLAALLGKGPQELTGIGFAGKKLQADKVAQIGLRDVDQHEKGLLKNAGIHAYTMTDIDRRGIASIIEEALEKVLRDGDLLHVSFDIDSLDPRVAPGTGTPKFGGLTYREAHLALEMIAETKRLTSFEMVEVNPILDERNRTAEVAVDLITSALGKRIL